MLASSRRSLATLHESSEMKMKSCDFSLGMVSSSSLAIRYCCPGGRNFVGEIGITLVYWTNPLTVTPSAKGNRRQMILDMLEQNVFGRVQFCFDDFAILRSNSIVKFCLTNHES